MNRGGKRKGAGRPSKNSIIKPISLPLELFQFVKENNLSLSKLAQQKIREEMAKNKIYVGRKIKGNRTGVICTIVKIEGENVTYKAKEKSILSEDGNYTDTKDIIIKSFSFV